MKTLILLIVLIAVGCGPADIGVCDSSAQELQVLRATIATQDRTIKSMQELLDTQSRISAVHDSSDRLCDSLVIKVNQLAHRVRVYNNPLLDVGR